MIEDYNQNGNIDSSEINGIAGITVLLNGTGVTSVSDTIVTNQNGFYEFVGLHEGVYSVIPFLMKHGKVRTPRDVRHARRLQPAPIGRRSGNAVRVRPARLRHAPLGHSGRPCSDRADPRAAGRKTQFRRALSISQGDPGVFYQHPISAGLFALTALLIVVPWVVRRLRRARAGR